MDVSRILTSCAACGGKSFSQKPIIWDELAKEWGLTAEQRRWIDLQQGLECTRCHSNLRSMTLASAILRHLDLPPPLAFHCQHNARFRKLRVLEINEAGSLTQFFRHLPLHFLATYPRFDLQNLRLPDNEFHLVVHSDTLEHVPDSVRALRECHRVLMPRGCLAYTVPIIPNRLTRSRASLPASYHGGKGDKREDYRVQREYGGDFWHEVFDASFRNVLIHSIVHPASFAIIAEK